MENKPIRVLQVFAGLGRGGAETMIMNYYRRIDRNKVQFDFVVRSKERLDYEDEIESLGGEIYHVADLFLLPSLYEGFGIAKLEVESAGLKTITLTNVPRCCCS